MPRLPQGHGNSTKPAKLRRGDPACGVSADTLKVHIYKYKTRGFARAANGRDALPRLPKGNGNAKHPTLRRLVAGKAPWQTAHFACRPARCACRSSSQKSRFAAIFGSPVLPLAGFRREPTIPYIEKAALHGRLFQYKIINVFGTALSFKTRSLHSLRSLRMTGRSRSSTAHPT